MPDAAPELVAKERLSDALRRLLEVSAGGPLAVHEMVEIMRGRGLHMIIILLCLPFLSPVTIPGISLPFGLAIALCGFRVAFGRKPWLPAWIMNRKVPGTALEKMVRIGCAIYDKVEKIIRPRLAVVFDAPGMTVVTGVAIAVAGICLSLPIPPPFPLTNTIPGFAIIFLALGLMERDGLLILLGYVLTILAVTYVAAIALLGQELWQLISGG